jgi:MGT family glycosyltransferase
MPKGLFFSLPSISVANTLMPVIEEASLRGYEMVCYNTDAFRPKEPAPFRFMAYPDGKGFGFEKMDVDISYFQFGEFLTDTAIAILDFLLEEVEREKPDFILHSHLALWGKLVARHFQIPAVSLFSTFVLDERIMVPFIRKLNTGSGISLTNISQGRRFFEKLQSLHDRLHFPDRPDIWDIYVNREQLNISFILGEFQPQRNMLGDSYHFVGPTFSTSRASLKHDLIYVSLGTIFTRDIPFYRLCIEVLRNFNMNAILSIGDKIEAEELGDIPGHIRIETFSNQTAILEDAALFITHGGMASVHEAVYTSTPMIVIPAIPEQVVTAESVETLGIGIQLEPGNITRELLHSSIRAILDNHRQYVDNLNALTQNLPESSGAASACTLIDRYLGVKAEGKVEGGR